MESEFPVPALVPSSQNGARAPLRVEAAGKPDIKGEWPRSGGTCVERVRDRNGAVFLKIDSHERAGYRMDAGKFGLHRLDVAATTAVSAPRDISPWRRERFLVARVLPIAALIRGHELIHASSVVIDDSAVAFVGRSRAGKTSLALHLALRGNPLLTDDLLALTQTPDGIVAHPGTMQVGIRHAEHERLSDRQRASLAPLADRGDKVYGRMPVHPRASPLRLLYFLHPCGSDQIEFVPISPPDPRLLFGSVFFNQLELTRRRLSRQLALFSRIGREVTVVRALVPEDVGAAKLAAQVEQHASSFLAAAHAA